MTNHGAELRRLTRDPVLSERIAQDYRRAGLDPKTRAMARLRDQDNPRPVECDEADIEKLRELDFGLDEVYGIITTASAYNYNKRLAEAAGYLPERASHEVFRKEDENP